MKIRMIAASLVTAVALSGVALAQAPGKMAGGMMTDSAGMTLYAFDKDAGGKSACNGPCAANWPPFLAAAGAKASGDWTIIARDDGSKQWAYDGKPLYHWSKDKKPGDMTGDGFNGVWHAVKG
ncbi:MAG: COG4315 family predicted lipoprotein, partial [Casimicrobiaceae bacterium]